MVLTFVGARPAHADSDGYYYRSELPGVSAIPRAQISRPFLVRRITARFCPRWTAYQSSTAPLSGARNALQRLFRATPRVGLALHRQSERPSALSGHTGCALDQAGNLSAPSPRLCTTESGGVESGCEGRSARHHSAWSSVDGV